MRKLIVAALLLTAPIISACNTVEGAGKDVKAAGNAIEKSAEKAKPGN
ncbi:MAG: entericidin A/B family lipoprotein [Alphaproteobacteria bacterium]|nr:entericidin A/B family lipoprotein [Alphaproteobacteria bacterium]